MRKTLVLLFSLSLISSVLVAPVAAGAPPENSQPGVGSFDDSLPNPLADAQAAAQREALELVLQGKEVPVGENQVVSLDSATVSAAPGDSTGGRVRHDRKREFVELAREGEDTIWTVLGQFGDAPATHNHGTLGVINHGGPPGPEHNQIPRPNRRFDNSSIWVRDFSEAHYERLLFSEEKGRVSMRNYYIEQSSGSYAVNGDVTAWVEVPNNAAAYGADYCGSNVCADTWLFVRDSVNAWVAAEVARGQTPAQIQAYLSQYDIWDRYDYDIDGNFDEPDGYIDHFQSVHAGTGQEVGGGAQGTDAIWSHRWYAFFQNIGITGPAFNRAGGIQIGTTGFWIGDYTIEPEDGGVGVFAHEFAHDLNLPDLYDTAGGENSTGFWTLMSSGSYGNSGRAEDGLGTKPVHMGVYEKLQLGWLGASPAEGGFDVFSYDESAQFRMGPSMHRSKDGLQAAFVLLPDREVVTDVGDPFAGTQFYYSGAGANLDNRMYRSFDFSAITAGTAIPVTAQVNFDIETDWDYAYLIASTDGGATWTNVHTNLSTNTDPNFQNDGEGITGTTDGEWVPLTADLVAFAGQANVLVGFRYWTDPFVNPIGFMADEIMIGANGPFGAEDPAADGFTFVPPDGFHATTGLESSFVFNAYVLEYRQYNGYDASLKTGPYNFGFLDQPNRQNWVEHFPYQDGLLISYWNAQYDPGEVGGLDIDNNTSEHPGEGFLLPVDAHPVPMFNAEGDPWRARVQSYDSTFGTQRTERIELHVNSEVSVHPQQKAVPLFDDSKRYWNPASPLAGVKVPTHGVQIQTGDSGGFYMWVTLNP